MLGIWGSPDTPVANSMEDLFNINSYVHGLCTFIRKCDTPMTISIQGDWGSGKTSIMNMMRERLQGEVVPIWFNTWQFSQFQMGNALAFSMLDVLMKNLDKDSKIVSRFCRVAFGVAKKVTVIAADTLGGGKVADMAEGAMSQESDIDYASEILKLRDSFQEAIDKTLSQKHRDRVVIFVDDLDRLQPSKAVELLEVLKLFLDCKKCVFVLAVDYSVVTMGIREKYGSSVSAEKGRSFFDKIIQLPFKMPVDEYDIENYLRKTMSRMELDTSEKNVEAFSSLIRNSIGYNPRAMKRLFNTFQLLNIITGKTSVKIETSVRQRILFAIICMQMKFENLHHYLVLNVMESESSKLVIDSKTLLDLRDNRNDVYDDVFGYVISDDAKQQAERDHKISKMMRFMESFIDALQVDDDDDLSEEELLNLSKILKSSTITSVSEEANWGTENIDRKKRLHNKDIVDQAIEMLSDLEVKPYRYMKQREADKSYSNYVSINIDFTSVQGLRITIACGIKFIDATNIGVSMSLFGPKHKLDSLIDEFGTNPFEFNKLPNRGDDQYLDYPKMKVISKYDDSAADIVATLMRNAYNTIKNK